MNRIVVEAEFVEIGKHQKVSTVIETMDLEKARSEISFWFLVKNYPKVYGRLQKEIRNKLRSFGWYIVKTKRGYSLMEEVDTFEYGFHNVWVPSLNKYLVMRSVD